MTQNTQTTAERIREIIDSTVEDFGLETETRDTIASSKIIAAEIDRLTAEVASKQETIDMLLEDERDAFRHERAQLEARLAEARAMASEREDFRLKQIADIRQERDEARDKLIEVRNTLHHANNEFAVILRERDDSTDFVQELREAEQATLANTQRLLGVAHAELAEARAEVERLRLPAEAWEADEHYGNLLWSLPVERDTAQEEKLQQAATKRRETSDAAHAGARAREATRERRQELENELESVRDDFRKLTAERNALKAEAERLRPAAEAWRSLPEDVQIDAEVAAAARARAAKVTP